MITCYRKSLKQPELKTLDAPRDGVWVNVEQPNADDLAWLQTKLGLDESLLHDALDPYEVPRLELEDGVVYIFGRYPLQGSDGIATAPFLIALGDGFLCTFASHPLPFLPCFLEGKLEFVTTQKTKFLLQLFSELHATYQRFLTRIRRNVRSSSVKLERISNDDIAQFVHYEMILSDFLSALVPSRSVLETLLSGKAVTLYEEDRDLVEDLLLSSGQLTDQARSVQQSIVYVREAYSTIMGNNLNRVIKLFTSLTVLLTVPMVISSFYGMNVTLPYMSEPWIFGALVGSTIGIVAILLAIFARNRWL